jgi:hypothetical protein
MRYYDLLETIDTHQIYRVSKKALSRVIQSCIQRYGTEQRTVSDEDDEDDEGYTEEFYIPIDEYYKELRKGISAILEKMASLMQDDTKPVKIYTDYLGSNQSSTFGFFHHDEKSGMIDIEVYRLLRTNGDDSLNVEETARMIAKVFAHEFMHYKQRLLFWNVDEPRRTSQKINKATKFLDDGSRQESNEIQAHAADAARELMSKLSISDIINLLRTKTGIQKAEEMSLSFKGYSRLLQKQGGDVLFREFIRHLLQQIKITQVNK